MSLVSVPGNQRIQDVVIHVSCIGTSMDVHVCLCIYICICA